MTGRSLRLAAWTAVLLVACRPAPTDPATSQGREIWGLWTVFFRAATGVTAVVSG
ncbi:MAG: hypothetical protein ACRDIZ_02020 [Actinomycetota bacterium]